MEGKNRIDELKAQSERLKAEEDMLNAKVAKVKEEIAEVEEEMRQGNAVNMEKEFGDLLFSLVNASRLYGINPDNALEQTNTKFRRRFNYVEEHSIGQGRNLRDMSLGEMDALWNEAKSNE